MTTRAAILVRVSSEEQADESKTSLDQQVAACEALAAAHGWEVASVYREEGVSGAKPAEDRIELQRLIADARADQFDVVLVHKFDRFSRSTREGLNVLHELEEGMGVRVLSASEDIDASTPPGKLFRSMLLQFADFERERIRERAWRNLLPG